MNQFLGTFRDFADDDDDSFEKDIKSVEFSDWSSDSFSSNSELFDEVEFSSEEMCENGSPEYSMANTFRCTFLRALMQMHKEQP